MQLNLYHQRYSHAWRLRLKTEWLKQDGTFSLTTAHLLEYYRELRLDSERRHYCNPLVEQLALLRMYNKDAHVYAPASHAQKSHRHARLNFVSIIACEQPFK